MERSLSAAAASGAGGEVFSLGLRNSPMLQTSSYAAAGGLCDKALLALGYRDSQRAECVSNCGDNGETGQVRLWLGSVRCTDAVSSSQILGYSSYIVGERRTAYVLPSAT